MNPNMENPASGCGGAPKFSHCWQALVKSENKANSPDIQDIRAGWIARKARIPHNLAAIVAPFAFGREGANV